MQLDRCWAYRVDAICQPRANQDEREYYKACKANMKRTGRSQFRQLSMMSAFEATPTPPGSANAAPTSIKDSMKRDALAGWALLLDAADA